MIKRAKISGWQNNNILQLLLIVSELLEMLLATCILETKVMPICFESSGSSVVSLVQIHVRESSLGIRRSSSLGPGFCHIPQPMQWGCCHCVSCCALFVHPVSHPQGAPRSCWVQEEVVIIRADWKTVLHMTRSVEDRKHFTYKISS